MALNLIIILVSLLSAGIIAFTAILPIIRKRPIIFSNKTLLILAPSIGFSTFLSGHIFFISVVVLLMLCLLFTRLWFIIGIKDEDLIAALNRTIKGTLAKAQLNPNELKVEFIKPVGTMNFYHKLPFNIKVCIQHLPSSPKTKLFQDVLKKIIDNYYIHI